MKHTIKKVLFDANGREYIFRVTIRPKSEKQTKEIALDGTDIQIFEQLFQFFTLASGHKLAAYKVQAICESQGITDHADIQKFKLWLFKTHGITSRHTRVGNFYYGLSMRDPQTSEPSRPASPPVDSKGQGS